MSNQNQEAFNRIVRHLRKQGRRAEEYGGGCLYKAGNGDKCAVGCLIDDEHYNPDLEGLHVENQFLKEALASSGWGEVAGSNLIADMQHVHDHHDPAEWEDQFKKMAIRHRLYIPSNSY